MNGSDLRNATHDQAVDVIRNATSPVCFLVQSLAAPPGVRISDYIYIDVIVKLQVRVKVPSRVINCSH